MLICSCGHPAHGNHTCYVDMGTAGACVCCGHDWCGKDPRVHFASGASVPSSEYVAALEAKLAIAVEALKRVGMHGAAGTNYKTHLVTCGEIAAEALRRIETP